MAHHPRSWVFLATFLGGFAVHGPSHGLAGEDQSTELPVLVPKEQVENLSGRELLFDRLMRRGFRYTYTIERSGRFLSFNIIELVDREGQTAEFRSLPEAGPRIRVYSKGREVGSEKCVFG